MHQEDDAPFGVAWPTVRQTFAAASVAIVLVFTLLHLLLFRPFFKMSNYRECRSNVDRLGVAISSYLAKHGTLPPAYNSSASGAPLLSWRVLVISATVSDSVASEFQLSQAWNSDRNHALENAYRKHYHCLDDPSAKVETSYVVVVGPETPFPGSRALAFSEKGKSQTILAVETAVSGIHWMEPRDMPFDGRNPWSRRAA